MPNEKSKETLFSSLKLRDIKSIYGAKALFFGISPALISYINNNLQIYGDLEEEYNSKWGYYWFYLSVFLWNPLSILIVRMQCVDFPYRKLSDAFVDMLKHDRHRMFYTGLIPIMSA